MEENNVYKNVSSAKRDVTFMILVIRYHVLVICVKQEANFQTTELTVVETCVLRKLT